jgi:lipoprotein-anchoring transpeptidase ErfK/SrfK
MKHRIAVATALLALAACSFGDDPGTETDDAGPASERVAADTAAATPAGEGVATAYASDLVDLSPADVEAGRMDSSWKRYVEVDPEQPAAGRSDSATGGADTVSIPRDTTASERWDDISAETVNGTVHGLPIHGDVAGASVAKVQILLDQVGFSPGVIDGRWGKNTEKAVYWFQKAGGLGATGKVDRATLDALQGEGGGRQVTAHSLTEADVGGPFQELPEDVYARAEQPCLCYESRREKLGEVFHTTPELLEQLNPEVDLDGVTAGQTLQVPAVQPFHLEDMPEGQYSGGGEVARIVISDGGHYVHALDQAGNILYHFPSTLGADYAPSPDGQFSVEAITFEPTWHYQPELLSRVDPSREDAVLPAGPNNAVGVVWMQLSKDHYGIHGTSAPSTIGYATSHGCVRLTNWDAAFLGQRIPPGVPVEFTDVDRSGG